MTRDPEQATADLRRAVRRLVEGASAEQLEAMREAWTWAATGWCEAPGHAFTMVATDREYQALRPPADRGRYEPLEYVAPGSPVHIPYTEAALSHMPPTKPALTPGQRVTIPARYCGEGCHGVRVGTVAAFCVPGEVADVEVPGHGFLCVPIKEIQT
jgi:hypothetical protein